jgi:hypothetical protein
MDAVSPASDMVRTKKEESGSNRTAKTRKGMAEANEAVNGSDATNPLIPNATPKILAAEAQRLPNTPCICGIRGTQSGSTMPTA